LSSGNYVHIECEIDKRHYINYGLWMTIETMGEPSMGLIDKNKEAAIIKCPYM
jgi:hypothetical protein